MNLEPNIPYVPFFLGQGIHHALHYKYEGLADSAVMAFDIWAEKELLRLDKLEGGMSLEDKSKLQQNITLGRGMLEHYELWQSKQDGQNDDVNLEFLALELSSNDVPLIRPDGEYQLPFFDDEPMDGWVNYGLRLDGVVKRKSDNTYWVLEHKTARSIDELVQSLDNDNQAGMYAWAAQHLLGLRVSGILYNIMRKKVPTQARTLKDGGLSQDKSIDTTFEVYKKQLDDLAWEWAGDESTVLGWETMTPEAHAEAKAQQQQALFDGVRHKLYDIHKDMLQVLFDKGNTFFRRVEVRRTQTELELLAENNRLIAKKMLDPQEPVYPSPLWANCNFCRFKQPCLMVMRGADPTPLLQERYRTRTEWADPDLYFYEQEINHEHA